MKKKQQVIQQLLFFFSKQVNSFQRSKSISEAAFVGSLIAIFPAGKILGHLSTSSSYQRSVAITVGHIQPIAPKEKGKAWYRLRLLHTSSTLFNCSSFSKCQLLLSPWKVQSEAQCYYYVSGFQHAKTSEFSCHGVHFWAWQRASFQVKWGVRGCQKSPKV